jgi:4'-phosphopantetheinyl transferase
VTVVLAAAEPDQRKQAGSLLRATAARVVGADPADVRLDQPAGTRPVLGGAAAGLLGSISHGTGITAVAVTALGPVGVDVEPFRPMPVLALARRWFAPAEAEWVAGRAPDEVTAAFLRIWTLKEAIGKALGTGLAGGLLGRDLGLMRLPPLPDRLAMLADGVAAAVPAVPDGLVESAVLAVACVTDADGASVTVLTGTSGAPGARSR